MKPQHENKALSTKLAINATVRCENCLTYSIYHKDQRQGEVQTQL